MRHKRIEEKRNRTRALYRHGKTARSSLGYSRTIDHPTHTDLPSFNSLRTLNAGDIYSYTFTQVGTWRYHNHLNHTDEGTIVVEE